MPRIPYVSADLREPREIVDAVRARRGGTLLNLDRMLLHSPELARGWNAHLGAVRTRLSLSPKLRELAMCIVAVINGAEYEFIHHAPVFVEAGGTQAQVEAMRDPDRAAADAALFDETERAALAVAIAMTRSVRVDDAAFDALKARLSEQQLVEYVATVATYNMVSRFLVAMGVEPE
ncbi:carboxymuconolactone decarboxylase family protein [Burkholderiaceae bacterium FT117]|uniref:carboxymuconolactone decarboxylase family protein n=1 Tax=Zeimonas sediminis TaxID=2944268 RepID=UPI002342DE5B|nr:carboxymuconolactone decarboxylase family protein [Zeimonas sediminis]MCM5570264.1 carboxymuconolactone decarboxylase family protein [Zeimonas sediminis]